MQFEKQQIKIDSNFTSEIFGVDRLRADELLDLTIPLLKKYSSTRNWRSRMEFYSFQTMLNDFTLLAKNRDEESFLIFQAAIKIEEWKHVGNEKGCQCSECRAEAEEGGGNDDEFLDLLSSIFGKNEVRKAVKEVKEIKKQKTQSEVIEILKSKINEEFGERGVVASVIDFDPFNKTGGQSLKLSAKDDSIKGEVNRFAKKILQEEGWNALML